MNKNSVYFIISLIAIVGLIFSVSAISAADTSNWPTITLNNVDFKIPPKYLSDDYTPGETTYVYEDLNHFGIITDKNSLDNMMTYYANLGDSKNCTVGNHHVAIFSGYNKEIGSNISAAIFDSGNNVYTLRYAGSDFNDEMATIIENTPDSNLSSSEFYNILNDAYQSNLESDYEYEEDMDYDDGYSSSDYSNHHEMSDDMVNYLIFYQMGRYSRY